MPLIFDFLKAGWRLIYFEKNAAVLVDPSVLSRIPQGVQGVDLGPMRFQEVTDPLTLLNVFSLYVNVYPKAGTTIYEIYRKNVSDCYKPKTEHLRIMEEDLKEAFRLRRRL